MKLRLFQIMLVLTFCAVGALLYFLPGILRRPHPVASEPFSPEAVHSVLRNILDPELGIGIVDLGLVDEVSVEDNGKVRITLVLTSPACPLEQEIAREIQREVSRLKGVREVQVQIDRRRIWSWDRMSEEARRRFSEDRW
jgi:metal-sulfur cluster biosynthetic enzyme